MRRGERGGPGDPWISARTQPADRGCQGRPGSPSSLNLECIPVASKAWPSPQKQPVEYPAHCIRRDGEPD